MPYISDAGIVNAGSYAPKPLAPGEMFTIFGTVVGPPAVTYADVAENGKLVSTVANAQVLIDGVPASLVFVSSAQTAAIMPFDSTVDDSVRIQITVNGFVSNTRYAQIRPVHIGIFTRDATGRGPGAVLNEDFTINSPERPAAKGSVVMVYATGLGPVLPEIDAGAVAGATVSRTVQRITATVDGYPADVQYSGTSPGLVASVGQVNIKIPEEAHAGQVAVNIDSQPVSQGGSQSGVTMFVK